MAQLKTKQRKTIEQKLVENKQATVNKEGGLAFKFDDPAEYLLATIGSAMFTEPKFYQDAENLEELKNKEFNTDGLDEQAVKILNACFQVSEGKNPRDLLALANWARNELNMRTVPQIMLAVAANCANTKQFVRSYVEKISSRADEVKQVVAAYEHLFGWKAFPACLKKGISDRMSKLSEYEILKYNTKGHPSFADLLKFCERRAGYPLSPELREYVLTGEVINPEATPMIAARKTLTSLKEWNDNVPALAKRAGATWEVLASQFGSKKEVWELASKQMGYMALLRNLANFLDADVSTDVVNKVVEMLSDKEQVLKSKQLPFRFMSAYRMLTQTDYRYRIRKSEHNEEKWNLKKRNAFAEAVEEALEHSVANIPVITGATLIAADNSGSMDSPLSSDSSVSIKDIANCLCSVLHKRCDDVTVLSFGTNVVPIVITKKNSVLTNAKSIAEQHSRGNGGGSTDAWKIFQYAISNKMKFDRIIVVSDMQCYSSSTDSWGFYGSRGSESVASLVKKYKMQVNKNCFMHFFDLQGYGTKQSDNETPGVNVVGGFSENIFKQILVAEGLQVEDSSGKPVLPSLDYIRKNY